MEQQSQEIEVMILLPPLRDETKFRFLYKEHNEKTVTASV